MNPIASSTLPGSAGCSIRGHAVVASRLSSLAALRDAASPPGCPALPPHFLRHSDEHTVVAVRAVLAAIAGLPKPVAFDRCGIVAAPCQAGRIAADGPPAHVSPAFTAELARIGEQDADADLAG